MDLYLVRHAAAFDPDETRWPDDRDRPLTRQGEKRFRRAARGLVWLTSTVDVLLSSSYRRAWQTAELLEQAGWPKPVGCEPLEAGRAPTEMLLALQTYAGSASLALVGHEPTMHELASYLLTSDTGHAQIEFRKGSVARVEVPEGLRPGTARLVWLLAPKVLRAINA